MINLTDEQIINNALSLGAKRAGDNIKIRSDALCELVRMLSGGVSAEEAGTINKEKIQKLRDSIVSKLGVVGEMMVNPCGDGKLPNTVETFSRMRNAAMTGEEQQDLTHKQLKEYAETLNQAVQPPMILKPDLTRRTVTEQWDGDKIQRLCGPRTPTR